MAQYILTSITVCGFRGIAKEIEIPFGHPLTEIFGDNRQGKSSLVNAIEWCFFGPEVARISYDQIRERADWEVKNLRSQSCWVECHLEDRTSGTTVSVSRRYKSSKATEFSFQVGSSPKCGNEGAFHALLNLSASDFAASVHLHPETVRNILTAKAGDRKAAMDRLLGLSEPREVAAAIKREKPAAWVAELRQQDELLDGELRAKLEEKKRTIDLDTRTLLAASVDEKFFTANGDLLYARELLEKLDGLAVKFGLGRPKLAAPDSSGQVPAWIQRMTATLSSLRSETPVLKNQAVLVGQKQRIDRLCTAYIAQHKAVETAQRKLGDLLAGKTLVGLRREIDELERGIKAVQLEIDAISNNCRTLSAALDFFSCKALNEMAACPVCGKTTATVESWKSHLLAEIDRNQAGPLQTRKISLISELTHQKRTVTEADNLFQELEGSKGNLVALTKEIEGEFQQAIAPNEDPLSVLNVKINSVSNDLDILDKDIREANAYFAELETRIRNLQLLNRGSELRQQMDVIESILANPSYLELQQVRSECERYVRDLETLGEIIEDAIAAEATQRLSAVTAAVSEYFLDLTQRADFTGLTVSATPDGYNIELVGGKPGQKATPVLNQADLNCAALSIFLALGCSDQISHRLSFIILDDPSQSMDATTAANFCAVLERMAMSRQVVIATADMRLHAPLQLLTKKKVCLTVKNWTPKAGPVVDGASVQPHAV